MTPAAMDDQETLPTLAVRLLRRDWQQLTALERRIVESVLHPAIIARDTNADFHETRTFGQRLSDRIATFGGSWTFIILFLLFLVVWAVLNTEILGPTGHAFDPYPYIFLNLMLSMVAALQAPIIMMSQNRLAAKDRVDAQHDYEVNLKAELEIRRLHDRLEGLRAMEWEALLRMQGEQIQLLERLAAAASPPRAGEG